MWFVRGPGLSILAVRERDIFDGNEECEQRPGEEAVVLRPGTVGMKIWGWYGYRDN